MGKALRLLQFFCRRLVPEIDLERFSDIRQAGKSEGEQFEREFEISAATHGAVETAA